MNWVSRLFNEHKFVRRTGMVLCFVSTIAIVVVSIYSILTATPISDPIAKVFIAVLAHDAVYIGLYQWSRGRDNP